MELVRALARDVALAMAQPLSGRLAAALKAGMAALAIDMFQFGMRVNEAETPLWPRIGWATSRTRRQNAKAARKIGLILPSEHIPSRKGLGRCRAFTAVAAAVAASGDGRAGSRSAAAGGLWCGANTSFSGPTAPAGRFQPGGG